MKLSRFLTLLVFAVLACVPLHAAQPTYASSNGYISETFFTMNFDVALDAANPPAAGSFSVQVNGTGVSVPSIVVDGPGKSVRINLTSTTLTAGDIIEFSYTDPTGGNDVNALQGTDGADAATFSSNTIVSGVRPATTPVINSSLTASGTYGTAISTYTITATNTPTSYNATNLPPGLSINTGNGQITGTPTAAALTGSPYSVTISATNGGGTGTATLVFTINKAVITVSGVTASSKVYDGTTTASVDYSGGALGGNVGADAVQADLGTATPNFSDRNVGTGKTVTITGITLSGSEANRYTLTNPTMTANITAKALTVTGLTGAARAYDGTTTATFSGTATLQTAGAAGSGTTSDGKPYTVDSASVTGTPSGTFASKNVGTAKAITVTGLSLTGTGSSNYTVTQPSGLTANVTAKALTITGYSATSRTYDGTTTAVLTGTSALLATEAAGTGTTSDGKPYTGDTVNITGTAAGAFADRHADTGKTVTITGLSLDNSNYSVATVMTTATITAKALTVSGLSAVATRVYDGTATASLSGTPAFQAAGTAGSGTTVDGKPYTVDTIAIGGSAAGAFADRHVGTAKAITVTGVTVTGTDNSNYTVTQPTGLTADVTAKALTVSGLTATGTQVYDGTTTASLTGTAAFQAAGSAGSGTTSDGKPYTVDSVTIGGTTTATFANRNVGPAKAITVSGITATGTGSTNYTVTQPSGLSGAITAKALTVAGLSAVATRAYDGTATAGITGTAAFQTAGAAGSGTTSDGKPYTVDTITLSGTPAGAFADRHVGTAKAITVTGVTVTGTDSGNYTVTQPTGFTAIITAKALSVSGLAAVTTRTYDGTAVAGLTGTAAFAAAETVGSGNSADGKPYTVDTIVIGGTAAGAFADRHVGSAKAITVTGVTVSGTDSGNYAVTQPTGLTASITAKALSVSGLAAVPTRTYDGTTVSNPTGTPAFLTAEAAGAGTTVDGMPYTVDTIAIGGSATGAFADRNVGAGKAITISGLTVTGADSANYTVTQPTGLTGAVTAKALTVSGVTATASRTYDGTTLAGLTGTAAFAAAEAAGAGTTVDGKPYTVDTITISGTPAGTFADRNVGTAKAITVTGVTVSGTDSGNYTVTQPTGLTANVTAKALTVAGVTATDSVYNATTTATLGGTAAFLSAQAAGTGTTSDGKPYSIDAITIGGSAAGTFADRHVATAKAITVTGVTVTGTDSANYTVTQPTGLTANVTKKTLTISGVTASNKIYDGTTAVTLSGSPTLQSAEAPGAGTTADGKPYTGDTFTAAGTLTGTFADRHAGTGKTITIAGVTLTGAESGNYAAGALSTTADITPKALTISGLAATATRTYDGTTVAALTGTAAFSPAEATGTGTTADGIPYTVDSVTVGGAPAGAFATRHVGTAKAITVTGLTVTGAGNTNYTATQPTGLTANVTAKALTVAGLSAVPTRVYDSTATAGLTGTAAFLTAETAGAGTTSDGTPYTVDTITISGSAAGAFATKTVGTAKAITVTGVTVTGTDSDNYTVTQPTGLTASVTAAGLTVSGVTANNKIYDGNATAALNLGTAALVGVLGGDVVTIGTGSAAGVFNNKVVANGKTVTISGISISGTDSGNYTLTQPAATANVTAKTITVGGLTVSSKIYDGNTTGAPTYTGATFTGVVSGDVVTLVSSGGTATFNNKTVATGKTVTFAGLTLAGADAGNYTLTQPTTTADVTAKNITVSGITANTKTYNGTTAATLNLGTAALVGVVPLDVVTLNTGSATGTFSDASAGNSKAVTIAGLTITGADSANYTLTQPSTTASILQAWVNVAITNTEQTYDGQPKPVTVTVASGLPTTVLYSGNLTVPTNAGTYPVAANVTNPNFSGSATATLTIAKAPQTVSFAITGGSFAVGTSHALTATSTSGGPITYAVTSGAATISGSSVTVTQAGAVTIRATQAGTENYLAATADQSFTGVSAAKRDQTISFASLPNVPADAGSFTLNATASSGLPVSYTIISGPAAIAGTNSVVLSGTIGLVVIRASQAGNAEFNAAPNVVRALAITQPLPDIFFGDLSDDPGIADGRGELFAGPGARVAAKRGDVAAVLFTGTNRGTVAIVAPSLNLNVSVDFALAANNQYSAPFTSGGRALTLTGTVNNGSLTGRIAALNVNFSTPALARTGATSGLAGIYETDVVNSATGGTTTIVSATGQVLVVTSVGTTATGAVGTIGTNGSFNLTGTGVLIAGTVDAPTTSVTGTITVSGQAAVPFNSLSALASHTDRLINVSSRVRIAPTRTSITGFVIGGTEAKRVLIRGVGPALTGFGVSGALANPKLSLFDGASKLLIENDDWSGADVTAAFAQVGAFALTAGSKDAAILTTLAPGAYSVQLTAGAETGTGLVEIYDASADAGAETQRLVNISTRGNVEIGSDGLLIGGFVVTGNVPKKVLIRGVGPGLANFGVAGTLIDPQLSVFSGSTLIARNDDWSTPTPVSTTQSVASSAELTAAAQSVGAFSLTANSKDSALVITLAPGAYTAQISGANGATGTAIVEVYELP